MANSVKSALCSLLLLFCLAGSLCAQEGGIKATTTLHPDGTRTDLIKDFATATAESKTFDAAGKVIQSMTFKINEKGDFLEGTAFNSKGVAVFKYTYVRDDSGLLTEERNMDAKGNLLRRLVYHYNTTGAISGIDTYDAQGNLLQPAAGSKKSKRKRQIDN